MGREACSARRGRERAALPDLLVDDDGEGGGQWCSVGKEAGGALRGREVGDGTRWGGRRAALGEGGSGRGLVGRNDNAGDPFASAVGVRRFWLSSSSTARDPNDEIRLVFGSALLEIALAICEFQKKKQYVRC